MSKAKYMSQRVDSAMSVVVWMERLTAHIFSITSNEKQFPKSLRFTLSERMRNTALKANENLYNAAYIRPTKKKDYKRIQKFQRKTRKNMIALKSLITIATDIAKLRNVEYLASLYDDTVDAYNHWIKSTQRAYNKFKREQAMSPEEKEMYAKQKREQYLSWKARTMRHDEDGFVVLVPRKNNKEASENVTT
ncbi:hypothetical protein [uncultured Duncaniella sp.]|uniref:hypothetical protein n=1 Tax=uncultured Duncaniella sp. TaxID=2768039 RepID=UPI0026313DC8|nr:hypothetical protein [uncultured Duncaniella sp.]